MLKQSILKKENWLVAATIILLVIGYQLAFKKTIEAWQLNTSLKKQLAQSTDVSYQPLYQERRSNNITGIINLYKADTVNLRSNIISTIDALAEKEKVKLSEVPIQDPLYKNPLFIIQKLDFEGDYFSLVKTLNRLQSTGSIGVVRAVDFKTISVLSNSDKARRLVLEVYLEIVR